MGRSPSDMLSLLSHGCAFDLLADGIETCRPPAVLLLGLLPLLRLVVSDLVDIGGEYR